MVDGVAHIPELRRGHHLALHQAAGRILFVAQAALDGGAVDLGHGRQDALALVVLEVLDDGGRVVGIQLLQRFGQGAVRHPLQHFLANAVVQFGQGRGQQLGRQPQHHDRAMLGDEPQSALTDDDIKASLYEYYFNVEQAMEDLLG